MAFCISAVLTTVFPLIVILLPLFRSFLAVITSFKSSFPRLKIEILARSRSAMTSEWILESNSESISVSVLETSFRQRIISALAKDPVADESHQDPQPSWSWDNGSLLRDKFDLRRWQQFPYDWNYYVNTMITLSLAISESREPLNYCHAIIGSPACMLLSNRTSLPAIPALVPSPHVNSNTVNSRPCRRGQVPGNQYWSEVAPDLWISI